MITFGGVFRYADVRKVVFDDCLLVYSIVLCEDAIGKSSD